MRLLASLFDNLLYKGVALFVAIILWAATQGFRSVEESFNLPVSIEEYDRDAVVVVDQSAQEVNLRIVGSQAAVRRAAQQMKRFPVSLARVSPGELRIGVAPEQLSLPRGARVAAFSPSNLMFRIEPVERRTVKVRADTTGSPPTGFRLVGVEVEPSELAMAGARSSISRLRELVTERIDVSEIRADARLPVQVVLGRPHVWREDQQPPMVTVVVRVEPIPDPMPVPAPGEADRSPI